MRPQLTKRLKTRTFLLCSQHNATVAFCTSLRTFTKMRTQGILQSYVCAKQSALYLHPYLSRPIQIIVHHLLLLNNRAELRADFLHCVEDMIFYWSSTFYLWASECQIWKTSYKMLRRDITWACWWMGVWLCKVSFQVRKKSLEFIWIHTENKENQQKPDPSISGINTSQY